MNLTLLVKKFEHFYFLFSQHFLIFLITKIIIKKNLKFNANKILKLQNIQKNKDTAVFKLFKNIKYILFYEKNKNNFIITVTKQKIILNYEIFVSLSFVSLTKK